MLDPDTEKTPRAFGSQVWLVQGARYANAAAKFWSALIDELCADYPQCDAMIFEMLNGIPLTRDLLFPEQALQRELDGLNPAADLGQILQDTLAEFKVCGGPGAVRLRLLSADAVIRDGELPLDCVDADLFPCLVVWLLEWAEIPDDQWNQSLLSGRVTARDRARGFRYQIAFEWSRAHVSEGLFRNTLTAGFLREKT